MTAFPTVGDWRWAGKPALNIGTGGDTHPTRKFGIFFYLEVPKLVALMNCVHQDA
ncbi:hypothetical protein [Scytonema sp. PRP1]|uniref:hypothetical protein n=1 Tax=Scytonema sp. PRP1 TaxID=3120513 RepID=UPI002FD52B52